MNIVKLEQGSQQWLDFRRNGVGASDVASIAGIEGAFQKRKDVMAEKLGRERKLTEYQDCLLYTSPSPRDGLLHRMPSSA